MKSKRTQALFTQAQAALTELFGEFEYLDNMIQNLVAELKQLKFELRGMLDMRKVYDALPTPEEVGLTCDDQLELEREVALTWDERHQLELFDAAPHHPTDLRCEDMADYMIDYENVEAMFDVTTWLWVASIDVPIGDRT